MKCELRVARGLVPLSECPPGLFVFNGSIGFKAEYRTPGVGCDAYCVESGEYFWGGTDDPKVRSALKVSPAYLHDKQAPTPATEGT